MNKLKYFVMAFAVSFLVFPALGGMGPAGGVMLGVHAFKGIQKHKEKKEEAEAENQKLEKLRVRYPQDVTAYEKLLASDPAAAKRKLSAMVTQYKNDTGEDLDKTYAVKKREGLLKRIRGRLRDGGESKDDDSSDSNSSRRGGLFSRIF